jgi:pilus assembly protein FimV
MHRWKLSVLAAAAALSAGLYATDASALALGRVNVQSALGEPLRAEIELPQITPSEADSLRVAPASPEVFRAQGLEYSPAAHNVQVQLHRRPDGSMVLRLSSTRPINDPFVDLVIDASWSSGHLVRSYTMLFDPPALRRPQAAVTTPPQVAAPRAEAAPAPVAPRPPAAAPIARPPAPAPAPAPAPTPRAAAERPQGADEVTVRAGDTAGRIAGAHKPASVSLDQMLVAMMRANPDAFVRGNVNRLRAGAVLQMPSEADAQATPATEARQIIATQSRDFNEFRRRLASASPTAEVAAAQRTASGSVQTQVEDRKPTVASPDKLTLSKGSVQAQKADDKLARDKQADQNAARMAELSKNISELNQISGGTAKTAEPGVAPATAPAAQAGPGVSVPAPAGLPASAPAASAETAPGAESAPAPAAPASEPAAAAPEPAAEAPAPAPAQAPKPAPQPVQYEEPSFLDSLTEDPLLAGGALALLLALLGYGGYRIAQRRRNQGAVDSSFLESRLQPDSFFGASGGQRVDTANSDLTTGSSSMTYSPSQLDAGGDVDPVAEADVYLAYGRDLQAEEILKEAARHHPERVSIPAKLAEIYAKRQDRKALEAAASEVFTLSNGQGPDWARVSDLGRTLDPDNALYQPGGRPAAATAAQAAAGAAAATAFASTFAASAPQPLADEAPNSILPDLDLDLDLDLHEAPPAPDPAPAGAFAAAMADATLHATPPAADVPPAEAPAPELDLGDLELPDTPWEPPAAAAQPELPDAGASGTEPSPLDFQPSDLSLMDSAVAPLTSRDTKAPTPEPHEFDLGDLSLDLGAPSAKAASAAQPVHQPTPAAAADPLPDDPLATKLALAEEFNTIGDSEGARSLIEEVVAESSGDLKARAQRLLAELG